MDPVHRISIVSRGMALGYTLTPPERDRLHESKSQLIDQIAVTMGGRAAEELVFNEITSGAANDFVQATKIARYMVMEFGMSSLGPISLTPQADITDWGRQYFETSSVSQDMQAKIDAEVKKILAEGRARALEILKTHRKQLDRVAEELMKRETIEGDEFANLMKNGNIEDKQQP